MREEAKLKLLRRKLDEYEKDQTKENEQRDSVLAVSRAMMNMVTVTGGQKGRTKVLDAVHEALLGLMTVHPLDLNKMIVADLANEHAMKDSMYETLDDIMDVDEMPADIRERLDAMGDRRDKQRVNGLRRLQAFLKVRPDIIRAFRGQGLDVSGIPGALEDEAHQRAASRQSSEKKT